MSVKEDAFGDLEICGERTQKCDSVKPRVTMTSDQTSLYVVLRLGSKTSPPY